MSSTSVSTLDIRLIDDVSPGAKAMADALQRAGERASQFEKSAARALSSGVSEKLLAKLKGMGAGAEHVTGITKAFGELAKAQNITLGAGTKLTLEQTQAWKNLENVTLSTTRAQLSAERAVADAQSRNHSRRLSEMASERQHFRAHLRDMIKEASAATGIMGGVFGAVKVGEHAIKSGAEYNTEVQNLKDAGSRVSPYIPAAVAEANRVAKEVPGTTAAENLRVINETRMAFGGIEESIRNLKLLQEASQAVKIASEGKSQPSAEEMGQAFAKVFEMRGVAMNEPEFKKQSDAAVQAMVATRGRFTPDKMLDFAQGAGRGTISNMSTRYLTQVVPTLVGDSSSPSMVGNQQKAFRQIIMGHLSSKMQVEAWEKAGLIADRSKVHKKGMSPGWDAGAVVDWQMALSDPDQWVEKHLLPGIKKQGVDIMNPLQLSGSLGGLAPKGRANDYLESVSQAASRKQLHADAGQYTDAHSAAEVVADHARLDPSQGVQNVNAGITSLFSTLTSPMMPAIGTALDYLRDKINQLNEAAQKSPAVQTATVAAAAVAIPTAGYFATKTAANMARNWWNGGSSGHRGPTGPQPVETAPADPALGRVLEAPKVGLGAAATDLGTIGLLAWWASISDIGKKHLSPESLKANPLGIRLPGENAPSAAAHGDEMGREAERGRALMQISPPLEKLKDDFGLTGFVLGQLNDSAARAATSLASLASFGGGGAGGGGRGVINASWDGGDAEGGSTGVGGGAASRPAGAGISYRGGGGSDGNFTGLPDTSGLNWSRMGVQMDRKRAFLGDHLRAIGATEFAAAGMLGNSNAESNFKADAFNPRLERSHGLFQLNERAGRWKPYLDWAKANGRNFRDPLTQLDYAKVESGRMRGPHGQSVWDAMQHAASAREASDIWLNYFERPKVRDSRNRGNLSDQALRAMRGRKAAPHITPTGHDIVAAVDLQHLHRAAALTREIKGNLADIGTMSAPHARGYKPGMIRHAMNMQFAGAAGRMG